MPDLLTAARRVKKECSSFFSFKSSALKSELPEGFYFYSKIGGYNVYVNKEPTVFAESTNFYSIQDFISIFSGINAIGMAIPEDAADNHVLLFCDCYTLTDLYYTIDQEKGILYASTDLGLVVDKRPGAEVDELSMFDLFVNGSIFGKYTPYKGIYKNYPLMYLKISSSNGRLYAEEIEFSIKDDITRPSGFKKVFDDSNQFITSRYDTIGLLYSGGADSTSILRSFLKFKDPSKVKAVHSVGDTGELKQAYLNGKKAGAKIFLIEPERSLQAVDLKRMSCALHGNKPFFYNPAEAAVRLGADCIISGQNADTISQLRNTRIVSLRNILRNIMLFGFSSNVAKTYLTRYIVNYFETAGKGLKTFYRRYLLHFEEFNTELDILLVFSLIYGSNPFYHDYSAFGFVDYDLYEAWFERKLELAKKLHARTDLTLRQKLLTIHLYTAGTGGDHRTITSSANMLGVDNFQVFTTPLLVKYFFNLKPSRRDVIYPKSVIRSYSKHDKSVKKISRDALLRDSACVETIKPDGFWGNTEVLQTEELLDTMERVSRHLTWFHKNSVRAFTGSVSWPLKAVYYDGILAKDFDLKAIDLQNTPYRTLPYEFAGKR